MGKVNVSISFPGPSGSDGAANVTLYDQNTGASYVIGGFGTNWAAVGVSFPAFEIGKLAIVEFYAQSGVYIAGSPPIYDALYQGLIPFLALGGTDGLWYMNNWNYGIQNSGLYFFTQPSVATNGSIGSYKQMKPIAGTYNGSPTINLGCQGSSVYTIN